MELKIDELRIKKKELLEEFIGETVKGKRFLDGTAGVFVIDFNGHLIFLNDACTRITGYTAEEAATLSYLQFVSLTDIDRVYHHFIKTIEGHLQEFVCEIMTKRGQQLPIHIQNSPIIVDGEVVGVYGIAKLY